MAISYDELQIKVSADVSQASRGLKSLSNNLTTLQATVKRLGDFHIIDNLQKHLQKIAKIDFSNVSQGLKDIVSAFRMIEHQASKKTIDNKLDQSKGAFGGANGQSGVGVGNESDKVANDVQQAYNLFREMAKISPQIAEQMKAMYEGIDNGSLENAKEKVEQMVIAVQKLLADEEISNQKTTEKKQTLTKALSILKQMKSMATTDSIDKSTKGIKKFFEAFKRVAFYRIVRRGLQMIMQAIKEGVQNLALFDSDFNKTMSELKSSFSYLKNSFASMVAPLIEMVAPILTMLADTLAEVSNELGKMFAMLQGKDQFAKATKGAEDYADSLKKAKSVQLGIDELNVAQKENASGFEMADSSGGNGALGGIFGAIKEKIEPLIEQFKTGLQPILQAIMNLFEKLSPIITIVVDLLTRLIGDTMDDVNSSITSFINMVGSLLGFIGTILEGLKPILNVVIDLIGMFINVFNEGLQTSFEVLGELLDILTDIVGALFQELAPLLQNVANVIGWLVNLGKDLAQIINGMVHGVLHGINQILQVLKPILVGISHALGVNIQEQSTGKRIAWGVLSLGGSELLGLINNIGKHANGGFVEDGLFMANHNELIGQFSNGKTAVANNEQITQGIYQAVLQAMNDSVNGGGREIVLKIDGREIGRASEKYEAQKGDKGVFTGGYHYGY